MPNGIPSRDCIRRLLLALKPEAFQRCFQDWITDAIHDSRRQQLHSGSWPSTAKRIVARLIPPKASGLLCTSSAPGPASGKGLPSARWRPTPSPTLKSPAIPLLLGANQSHQYHHHDRCDGLSEKHCYAQIVCRRRRCCHCTSVKDNQPTLKAAIDTHFKEHPAIATWRISAIAFDETRDEGHGTQGRTQLHFLNKPPSDFGPKKIGLWAQGDRLHASRVTQHADGTGNGTKAPLHSALVISARQTACRSGPQPPEHRPMHRVPDGTFVRTKAAPANEFLGNNLSWLLDASPSPSRSVTQPEDSLVAKWSLTWPV